MVIDRNLVKNVNEIFYDIESYDYDKKYPEVLIGERLWMGYLSKRYIKDKQCKGRILLDIATGTGFVPSVVLNDLDDKDMFIGYDISLEMLKQSRSKNKNNNFHVVKGDAESLSIKDKTIDIITINTALHHFPNLYISLKEINRVIKKGGLLIIAREPNKEFYDLFLVKTLARLYNSLWGIKINKGMMNEINTRLREKDLINKDLSKEEILRYVEFNSIADHKNLKSKDQYFSLNNILNFFKDYEVLEYKTVCTFIYRSNLPFKNIIFKIINKIFENKGSMFSMVLRKK